MIVRCQCGAKVRVPEEKIGSTFQCPKCSRKFRAPELGQSGTSTTVDQGTFTKSERQSEATQPTYRTVGKSESSGVDRTKIVFGAVIGLSVLLVGGLLLMLFRPERQQVQYTKDLNPEWNINHQSEPPAQQFVPNPYRVKSDSESGSTGATAKKNSSIANDGSPGNTVRMAPNQQNESAAERAKLAEEARRKTLEERRRLEAERDQAEAERKRAEAREQAESLERERAEAEKEKQEEAERERQRRNRGSTDSTSRGRRSRGGSPRPTVGDRGGDRGGEDRVRSPRDEIRKALGDFAELIEMAKKNGLLLDHPYILEQLARNVSKQVDLSEGEPDFPQSTAAIGIQYFPGKIDTIRHLNLSRLRANGLNLNRRESLPADSLLRLTGLDADKIEWITTGTIDLPGMWQRPSLTIVRTKESLGANGEAFQAKSAKRQKFGGEDIFMYPAGMAMLAVDEYTIAFGTPNEVLFAKRGLGLKIPRPEIGWLDFQQYDAVELGVYYSSSIRPSFCSAIRDGKRIKLTLCPNEEWAKVVAFEMKLRFETNLGQRSTSSYFQELAQILTTVGVEADFHENYPALLAGVLEKNRVPELMRHIVVDVEFDAIGKVVEERYQPKEALRDNMDNPGYYDGSDSVAAAFSTAFTKNATKADERESNWTKALGYLEAFERYRFVNGFERKELQEDLVDSIVDYFLSSTRATDSQKMVERVGYVLNNTSSAFVRSEIIEELADANAPFAVEVLAQEIRMRPLRANFFDDPLKDDPHRKGGSRYAGTSRIGNESELIELASYYLHNGSYASLVRDASHVLNELGGRSSQEALDRFLKSPHRSEAQKRFVQKCLDDFAQKEPLKTPGSIDEMIEWLKGTNRIEKLSALEAMLNVEIPKDRKAESLAAVVPILDDSLHFTKAMEAVRKNMEPEFFDVLHQVPNNVLNNPKFRMRQVYSLHRIVDLMSEFEDLQGLERIALIADQGLLEMTLGEIQSRQLGIDTVLKSQLELIAAKNFDNERARALSKLTLDADQKEAVRDWAKPLIGVENGSNYIMSALINTRSVTKAMVPDLIRAWAKSGGNDYNISNFIRNQCGPHVEELVIQAVESELENGTEFGGFNIGIMFDRIGTKRCLPVLRAVIAADEDAEKLKERLDSIVDRIGSRDAAPLSFEEWEGPE